MDKPRCVRPSFGLQAGTFDDTARWEGAESNDAGQPYQQDNQPGGVMRQRAREFQGEREVREFSSVNRGGNRVYRCRTA